MSLRHLPNKVLPCCYHKVGCNSAFEMLMQIRDGITGRCSLNCLRWTTSALAGTFKYSVVQYIYAIATKANMTTCIGMTFKGNMESK